MGRVCGRQTKLQMQEPNDYNATTNALASGFKARGQCRRFCHDSPRLKRCETQTRTARIAPQRWVVNWADLLGREKGWDNRARSYALTKVWGRFIIENFSIRASFHWLAG